VEHGLAVRCKRGLEYARRYERGLNPDSYQNGRLFWLNLPLAESVWAQLDPMDMPAYLAGKELSKGLTKNKATRDVVWLGIHATMEMT
jgi:hypothetical protein